MKLSKNKIIVSALALLIGTSLAGSITGTLAWYQYSTRANVSFIGESSGISGNLQMRFASQSNNANAWRTRITWQEMAAELSANGHHYAEKMVPMTYGAMERDDALPAKGYYQPKYLQPNMNKWFEAQEKHYAQFELQLRYNERDGVKEGEVGQEKDDKNVEKKVYLSKLVLQPDENNGGKSDLSSALRVHVSSSYKEMDRTTDPEHPVLNAQATNKNKLISKNGGATLTEGYLDLDNDNADDQDYPQNDEFGFSYQRDNNSSYILDNSSNPIRNSLSKVVYGEGAQISYAAKSTYVEADRDNKYLPFGKENVAGNYEEAAIYPALADASGDALDGLKFDKLLDGSEEGHTDDDTDKLIGQTMESETEYLSVKVTIWVEGWQKLDGKNGGQSAIWDEFKYINSSFNVGIQFAVEDAEL